MIYLAAFHGVTGPDSVAREPTAMATRDLSICCGSARAQGSPFEGSFQSALHVISCVAPQCDDYRGVDYLNAGCAAHYEHQFSRP